MKTFPMGGVHPSENKLSCAKPIEVLPLPEVVTIPLAQHIGAPAVAKVAKGDKVLTGQLIAEAGSFMSANIHSPVSGTVTAVDMVVNGQGLRQMMITIKREGDDWVEGIDRSDALVKVCPFSAQEIIAKIKDAGIVGMGGATFPTHVKLSVPPGKKADCVIINGVECEPYLTCDYRIMLEKTDLLLEGAELILRHMPGGRAVIGIENNKPKAIEKIKADAAAKGSKLEVLELKSRYPQGAEKVIVYEATGRVIPEGKLPSDVGVLVMNVGTVIKLAEYIKTGLPLTSRMVTVDGGAVAEPKNVWVPIGTKLEDIINFCGGYKGDPAEIILGGPMMGTSCRDDQTPLSKTNNGLLVFNEKEAKMAAETACIRCGRCLRACPLSLSPAALDRAYHAEDVEALKALHVNLCMECGCCAYVCPAKRHLVVYNQLGKQMIKK